MELDKVDEAKEDYIHSLVKHITCTNDPVDGVEVGVVNENDEQQPKKQVRRRVHTSKPYQERLMNTAEARREIAAALKFHRASMKQQEAQLLQSHTSPPQQQQHKSISGLSYSHHWPTIVPPPPPLQPHHESLNLVLPNQTLGLNLNFQDFDNLNTTSICYTTPSPVYSSSPAAKEVKVAIRIGAEEDRNAGFHEDDGYQYHPFEQVMEFPPWLINTNESSCLHDLFEYSTDPALALPCMDIGEIEGMDGEWLA